MTRDEFFQEFEAYARRSATRKAGDVFELSLEEIGDSYSPGETENPELMPLETVQRWLIRKSLLAYDMDADAAREWFMTQDESLSACPIEIVDTHPGVISVFRLLEGKGHRNERCG